MTGQERSDTTDRSADSMTSLTSAPTAPVARGLTLAIMEPLVFEPYLRPQVWGNRRLESVLGKPLPPTGQFGESWEVSAHPHHVSRVAEGPLRGWPLDQLWNEFSAEICGTGSEVPAEFPLLVKYLDCDEQLSVQVHPDDATARELLGEPRGKSEGWVVIAAELGARIYAGLRQGVSRADLERHLEAGTVADCLHEIAPQPGDCIYLPAGTVHGVGGGVLLAEVQQSSDATFRLFDWNRLGLDGLPRKLHREESLRAIDWFRGPVQPIQLDAPPAGGTNGLRREALVRCPYFELDRYRLDGSIAVPAPDRFSIWMILDGAAVLSSSSTGYERALGKGETILVPASPGGLQWSTGNSGSATLLGLRLPPDAAVQPA